MIIGKYKFLNQLGKFEITNEGTVTKQEIADYNDNFVNPIKTVKLVAQREMENATGYHIEDENGRIHRVGYKFYLENIQELMLPEIEFPKPNMTIEDAITAVTKFGQEYALKSPDEPFVIPVDYCKARDILGRDATKTLLEQVANIYKARK